ncbi:MAG TPA: DUF4129 domain-containing protein, partial [Thermoanaerobaculia bacterium]|nr:DUF4129 domain-containing protein [Thermoanaerobaculia bacterium]
MIRRALLALVLFFALQAHAATISIAQYLAALQHLDGLLAANEQALAARDARTLAAYEIDSPQGTFHADESLLDAVADTRVPLPQKRARLARTIAELRHATGIEGSAADRRLLEEVTAAQTPEELQAGGDIVPVEMEIPMIERILGAFEEMFEWLRKMLRRLLDWLADLFPSFRGRDPQTAGMRWIVVGGAIAIALLVVLLAWLVIRRSRKAAPEVAASSAPIGSERDADPLSRGANEWERYAMQLASEGRHREAIRAWFHAVLVTCYAEGILHFRKGRTNWEYIAALSPSHTWRPELITLTRRFEQEWYGSDASTD